MGRWKGKGGRKIVEVVGRWNGKGERKVGEVYILKKINVKTIIRKLERKKNPKAWKASKFCFVFCFFVFLPLSWKCSHKTLKLNWKSFGLTLIVELNK